MKKFLSLLLTVALVATSIIIPVTAATAGSAPTGAYYNAETGEYDADTNVVKEAYADFDLNDAEFDFTNFSVDNGDGTYTVTVNKGAWSDVISTTNKAITDKNVKVQLYPSDTYTDTACTDLISVSPTNITSRFYKIASISNDEPDNRVIISNSSEQYAYARFLVEDGVVPTASNQLVYLDLKFRRHSTNKAAAAIELLSADNKQIAQMFFNKGTAAGLIYEGGKTVYSDIYTAHNNWVHLRFIMNTTTDTFKLYVGDTIDTLKPFSSTVDTYGMRNKVDSFMSVGNLVGNKGTVGYDDVSIYMVEEPFKPIVSEVSMSGKPNLGETLTCSYSYMCEDGELEGSSYSYWEASDDAAFSNRIKITEKMPVKANQPAEYTIQKAVSGKYVRCVIVPVNEAGVIGDAGISNATSFPVDHITYSLKIDGQQKYSQFEFKDGKEDLRLYKGAVTIKTTATETKDLHLVAAFYEVTTDSETGTVYPELKSVKLLPITTEDPSITENGYVEKTYYTDAVYRTPNAKEDNARANTLRIKVMLVDSLKSLTPVVPYVTIGGGAAAGSCPNF